jgi:hypothetical protein
MNDFLTEIKEDIKRDRIDRIFNKHGKTIIALSAVVVLGVAAGSWYKNNREATQEQTGNEYRFLIKDQGEGYAEALDTFIVEKKDGYRTLAAFTKAKNLFSEEKLEDAIVAYDAIGNDSTIDPHLRQLAIYYAASIELNQQKDVAVAARVETLLSGDKTWLPSATELKASLATQQGKYAEAIELFTELEKAPNTPNPMKIRAGKAITALKARKEVN